MQTRLTQSDVNQPRGESILNAMRTYLTPALFNSKVNELKRHVPKMQTSNQLFNFFNKYFTVDLLAVYRFITEQNLTEQ